MLQYVAHVVRNAMLIHQRLLRFDAPHLLLTHIILHLHRLDVIHLELQHILVPDGIDDGVGVQRLRRISLLVQFAAKCLCGCAQIGILACGDVRGADGCACEAKQIVFLERLGHHHVHIAKLRAVTLVKYHHHILVRAVDVLFLLQQRGQFLNGGDDDFLPVVRVIQLLLQNVRRRVGVGATLLKVVILLHRLIIQILSIDHKEHLIHVGQLACQLCRLERGERLAATRCVPDVATRLDGALPLVHRRLFDAQQNPFRGSNLIGAHHHQVLIDREHAELRQHIQQRHLCQEGAGEISQIQYLVILRIAPVAGELKRLRLCLHPLFLTVRHGCHMSKACRVGVVFRLCAVRDDEHLHIVIQATSCPKRIPFIAVDLVERLLDVHTSPFQFHMYQRQTIHQDGHIVAVGIVTPFRHILVQHLQVVVVDVALVYQFDVLRVAIIARDVHNLRALNPFRLVLNRHLRRGDVSFQQLLPLLIRERHPIQAFHLLAKIRQQLRLAGDVHTLIALSHQLLDELRFQFRLALVASFLPWQRLIVRHHGGMFLLYDNSVVFHYLLVFVFFLFPRVA